MLVFPTSPTIGQQVTEGLRTWEWNGSAWDSEFEVPNPVESIIIACGDEVTAISVGLSKVSFRMPYAFNLSEIRGSLVTAQASGNIFTVDVKSNGVSILSTLLTIDNTEDTSFLATTPLVISTPLIDDNAKITIDVAQIGNGSAIGLKVVLIGRRQ